MSSPPEKRKKGEVTTYESSLVKFTKKNKIRKKGRPKKISMMPKSEEARVKKREKEKHLKGDSLLDQVKNDPNSMEVLDEIMRELALENSSLAYERVEAERRGEDTTSISSKKVTALKSLSEIYFQKRKSIVNETFDFDSDRFQRLLEFFFKKVRTAAENADISEEQIGILFSKIGKLFEDDSGWKEEARKYIQQE